MATFSRLMYICPGQGVTMHWTSALVTVY
jgi:hypothetical protein